VYKGGDRAAVYLVQADGQRYAFSPRLSHPLLLP
jgi:hypothetical protein